MKLSLKELEAFVATQVDEDLIGTDDLSVIRSSLTGLCDKIGKQFTLDTGFEDNLAELGGEDLPYGTILEEWYQDLLSPADYDSKGEHALDPSDPTYRKPTYSYALDRKTIKTTLRSYDVQMAVHSETEYASIVAMKSKRLQDSENIYKYQMKMEALGKLIEKIESAKSSSNPTFDPTEAYEVNDYVKDNDTPTAFGVVVKPITADEYDDWADAVDNGAIIVLDLITEIAKPVDTETGEAFIKQLKADVEKSRDVSEGNSLLGNTIGAVNTAKLFILQGIMPSIEVDTQAGAFNLSKVALPCEIKVIKSFGKYSGGAYAILMDRRGVRMEKNYSSTRSQENADGDFINLVRHLKFTIHVSKNVFVKVYKIPTTNAKKVVKATKKA